MSQVPEPAAFQVFQVPFTVADQTSIVRAMEQAEAQLREADGNVKAVLDRDLEAIEGFVVFLDEQSSGSAAGPIVMAERLLERMDAKAEAKIFDAAAQIQIESSALGVDAFSDEPAPATRTYSETDINPDTAPTGWYNACTGADLSPQHYFNSDARQWFDLRQRPISIEQMRSGRIYGGPYRDAITAAGDLGRLRSLGFVFCPAPPVASPTAPTAPLPVPTAPQPPPPAPAPAPLPGEEPKPEPAPAPGIPPPPQPAPVPSPAPAPLPPSGRGDAGWYVVCMSGGPVVRFFDGGCWPEFGSLGMVCDFQGIPGTVETGPFASQQDGLAWLDRNIGTVCAGAPPPPPAPPGACPPCPTPEPPPEEEEEPPQAGCSPCWPCPTDMVEEKGKYVSIVPWGIHQGQQAWVDSECGRRELAEAAAEFEPAGDLIRLLQSPGGYDAVYGHVSALVETPDPKRQQVEQPYLYDLDPGEEQDVIPPNGGGFQLPGPG